MADPCDACGALDLALFVRGELDGPRLASFEVHIAGCDACARALVGEARLELALDELGGALGPARSRVRPAVILGAALAAAAALVLLARAPVPAPAPAARTRAIAAVVCADGPDQTACVERAHRHGLFVRYPAWAGPPPFGWFSHERGMRAVLEPAPRRLVGPRTSPLSVPEM